MNLLIRLDDLSDTALIAMANAISDDIKEAMPERGPLAHHRIRFYFNQLCDVAESRGIMVSDTIVVPEDL